MMKTLIVDNFQGSMTLYLDGDINSGRSYEQVCSGANPFIKPGNLTWNNAPVQIDSGGSVVTDLIMAGKERVEGNILYVYAIGHTGRLYKIQVNDPTTYNPDYDNPVLLTTLTVGSPTFTRGGFIDFYGATEKIYIGHDVGVTTINFDGTGEAAVAGAWNQGVPRPLKQFLGKLYVGNQANIAEIDTTGTATTTGKLNPGFPTNSQVRDIDISIDGTYLEAVVSTLPLYDLTSATQQTTSTANAGSFIFKWNGVDIGYTSFSTFPSFSLSANILFQNYQYTFGTDQFGSALYNPLEKITSFPECLAPTPNAVTSTGNMVLYIAPTYFGGVLEADIFAWGSNDFEVGVPVGNWDLMFLNATAPETDINITPLLLPISNTGFGASANGYPGNFFGTSKMYFSTLETSSAPTTAYRLYKVVIPTSTQMPSSTPLSDGYYQTQTQILSKKVKINEVRVYGEPWIDGNAFDIDIIGSNGESITGSTKSFVAGTNLTIGDDFAWYTPETAPTYAIGVGITQKGTTNHTISKIEIDYSPAGK